jgi:hypothetical protein
VRTNHAAGFRCERASYNEPIEQWQELRQALGAPDVVGHVLQGGWAWARSPSQTENVGAKSQAALGNCLAKAPKPNHTNGATFELLDPTVRGIFVVAHKLLWGEAPRALI